MPIPVQALMKKKEHFERGPDDLRSEDFHHELFELEEQGEWIVQGVPDPIIPVQTNFGEIQKIPTAPLWHHKYGGEELRRPPELRAQVREIMGKLGKQMVMPEEIVHYSEWFYALKDEIAAHQVRDFSGIAATVHPACHYYKLVEGDALYDADVYGGQRTAIVTGVAEALGTEVRNYSTWFDCCGFGFRHIPLQRRLNP